MRTAKVLDRLKAEQTKNPDVPHYDSMGAPWPQPPSDVKTAGYWKLEGRRPARGEQPCAFVVSGHGSRYNPTGWVAAYHLSQTVEIRRRQAAPQPERPMTAARPIAPPRTAPRHRGRPGRNPPAARQPGPPARTRPAGRAGAVPGHRNHRPGPDHQ